jgi:hypothetical protein
MMAPRSSGPPTWTAERSQERRSTPSSFVPRRSLPVKSHLRKMTVDRSTPSREMRWRMQLRTLQIALDEGHIRQLRLKPLHTQ